MSKEKQAAVGFCLRFIANATSVNVKPKHTSKNVQHIQSDFIDETGHNKKREM